jgi:hypothetical protein
MISSEVQRTLVKSPPELWSELSDPAALARHLGELGEIRIVRVEAEKTVEWAAEHTTGTVSIQPSGWGTKVTLSVTRERVTPPPSPAEQESAEPTDTAESEPTELEGAEPTDSAGPSDIAEPCDIAEPTVTAEPSDVDEPTETAQPPVAELEATAEIEPASEDSQQQPAEDVPEPAAAAARRGFFARLFRRRREETAEPQSEVIAPAPPPGPAGAFAAVSEALAREAIDSHAFTDPPTPAALATASEQTESSVLEHETQADQSADIAAELMAAEEVAADEVAAEEVTAVLAAVLDRLGAAHHRPFSRS